MIINTNPLLLRGLLTHDGRTYHANSPEEVRRMYHEGVSRLNQIRESIASKGLLEIEISVGDTPECSLCEDFGDVDEIRPGNFVFFDTMQLTIGSCSSDDIAVALACPVVAKHPDRHEVVIYGGAVQFSKECIMQNGKKVFGSVALPEGNQWGQPLSGAYISMLSQEHGVLHLMKEDIERIQIGEIVCILPVHSCLTAQLMGEYVTLEGEVIATMYS